MRYKKYGILLYSNCLSMNSLSSLMKNLHLYHKKKQCVKVKTRIGCNRNLHHLFQSWMMLKIWCAVWAKANQHPIKLLLILIDLTYFSRKCDPLKDKSCVRTSQRRGLNKMIPVIRKEQKLWFNSLNKTSNERKIESSSLTLSWRRTLKISRN